MIAVPESVLAYFQQPSVQTAVDLLLTGKEPKVPANLRWEEVASFYRACLAAQQVQAEYALFLEALWGAVWTEIPAGWRGCRPSNPARPDLAIGIATIWSEGCFSRRFERQGYSLELSAGLWPDTGLQLGVLLYDEENSVLLTDDLLKGWIREGDIDTYWTQEEIAPLAATIDAAQFGQWRDQAYQAIAASV
ncbi:MAG: hypothetical protein ACK4SZ_02925 [Allosphingosinicella sp.]|uniref:hypothetical protein n=1 Tax=Allosphingosinicella sp. TaxID=2823234 RepID=UPI003952782D